ncbi:hypothetical protein APV93_10785 [Staphylococcus aureus]|nr:hypothetical protein APV93_10785 [Staphylococcus aureus]
MKKCIKTLFLSIILVEMGGWYHSAHASDSLSKSPENWLSKLDESKHLTEINMPGSHDSGSSNFLDFYSTNLTHVLNDTNHPSLLK